jgi:hypothetical protein
VNAQTIINSALIKLGALATGETPTTNESNDALASLNDMVDAWSIEGLTIYQIARKVYNFVAGQGSYTLGPGGTWNDARPPRIVRASVISNYTANQPLELPIAYITVGEWQQTPVKNVPSTLPFRVWDDQGFPLRTLTYWPTPTDASVQAVIYGWSALPQFADLTTDYQFPPGYAQALKYNLALNLAPEFGVMQPNPVVVQMAATSLGRIKVVNSETMTEPMYCDPAITGGVGGIYDWRTGNMIRRTG